MKALLPFLIGILSIPGNLTIAAATSFFSADFLKTVISIEEIHSSTNLSPIGTGFIIETTNGHPILVTAKHVISNDDGTVKANLAFRLNEVTNAAAVIPDSIIRQTAGDWFLSVDADLACRFMLHTSSSDIRAVGVEQLLPLKDLEVTAHVVVLGFPMGLRSPRYSHPIARSGIVARASDNELILDAFVFPGNSGGPALYSPVFKFSPTAIVRSPLLPEEMVIGVVGSYIPYTDLAVSPQTKRVRITFEENSGLCNIIPADRILELINRADVKALDRTIH